MARDEEKIDDLIKEIALKNGVAVGRRDPIMIVYTMNNRLLEDGKAAQQEALNALKSELEGIAHQWGEDAKSKAEKILNASLAASKKAMANGMQEGAKNASEDLKRIIGESTSKIEKLAAGARKAAYINLAASSLVVIAVIAALIVIGG